MKARQCQHLLSGQNLNILDWPFFIRKSSLWLLYREVYRKSVNEKVSFFDKRNTRETHLSHNMTFSANIFSFTTSVWKLIEKKNLNLSLPRTLNLSTANHRQSTQSKLILRFDLNSQIFRNIVSIQERRTTGGHVGEECGQKKAFEYFHP